MSATSNETAASGLPYRRVLLKISGEALMGEQNYGIDVNVARSVAEELKAVHALGVQVAVVVGGGNIFRGVSKSAGNMDRSSADYIGMLARVMNASAISLCMDNNLPIVVFNMRKVGNIQRVVLGEPGVGTRVSLGK